MTGWFKGIPLTLVPFGYSGLLPAARSLGPCILITAVVRSHHKKQRQLVPAVGGVKLERLL